MLLTLSINNIVLIESAEIAFERGFCVLTGETSAGKSILLDALGLALGMRAETRLLRNGEKRGSVTAEFDISDNLEIKSALNKQGLDVEDILLIRRVLYSDGKSKAYINDSPVSLNFLQEISEGLVEIHGQHDQRGLLSTATHGKALDSYGGLDSLVLKLKGVFERWKKADKEFNVLKARAEKAREEEDYLQHVYEELLKLDPKQGEEDKLAEQRTLLMNREKIAESLKNAGVELVEKTDINAAIRNAQRILERNDKAGDIFSPAIDALDKAAVEVDEALSIIENIAGNLNVDERSLDEAEERLFALRAASRKHKRPVDELSAYAEEVKAQLDLIENQDEQVEELRKKVESLKQEYSVLAGELTEKRKFASGKLEKELSNELKPIKMANSRFKAEIERLEEERWSSSGWDKISFLIATNAGGSFGPLGKIASGGELSRFMLALKVILSGTKSVSTVIFDEIDTGIGGAMADAVGNRLEKLAKDAQVLCVTHQPQVASHGDYHLRIDKHEKSDKTITTIEVLDEKSRKEEIARMLAGAEISNEARAAAVKLMGT